MIHQMVYASKRAATCSEDDVLEILHTARTYNARCGLTGMLLCTEMLFFQLLEGDKPEIEKLYASIASDPRHTEPEILLIDTVNSRTFGDWTMGFSDLEVDTELSDIPGLESFLQDPSPWNAARAPGFALKLLLSFQRMFDTSYSVKTTYAETPDRLQ